MIEEWKIDAASQAFTRCQKVGNLSASYFMEKLENLGFTIARREESSAATPAKQNSTMLQRKCAKTEIHEAHRWSPDSGLNYHYCPGRIMNVIPCARRTPHVEHTFRTDVMDPQSLVECPGVASKTPTQNPVIVDEVPPEFFQRDTTAAQLLRTSQLLRKTEEPASQKSSTREIQITKSKQPGHSTELCNALNIRPGQVWCLKMDDATQQWLHANNYTGPFEPHRTVTVFAVNDASITFKSPEMGPEHEDFLFVFNFLSMYELKEDAKKEETK